MPRITCILLLCCATSALKLGKPHTCGQPKASSAEWCDLKQLNIKLMQDEWFTKEGPLPTCTRPFLQFKGNRSSLNRTYVHANHAYRIVTPNTDSPPWSGVNILREKARKAAQALPNQKPPMDFVEGLLHESLRVYKRCVKPAAQAAFKSWEAAILADQDYVDSDSLMGEACGAFWTWLTERISICVRCFIAYSRWVWGYCSYLEHLLMIRGCYQILVVAACMVIRNKLCDLFCSVRNLCADLRKRFSPKAEPEHLREYNRRVFRQRACTCAVSLLLLLIGHIYAHLMHTTYRELAEIVSATLVVTPALVYLGVYKPVVDSPGNPLDLLTPHDIFLLNGTYHVMEGGQARPVSLEYNDLKEVTRGPKGSPMSGVLRPSSIRAVTQPATPAAKTSDQIAKDALDGVTAEAYRMDTIFKDGGLNTNSIIVWKWGVPKDQVGPKVRERWIEAFRIDMWKVNGQVIGTTVNHGWAEILGVPTSRLGITTHKHQSVIYWENATYNNVNPTDMNPSSPWVHSVAGDRTAVPLDDLQENHKFWRSLQNIPDVWKPHYHDISICLTDFKLAQIGVSQPKLVPEPSFHKNCYLYMTNPDNKHKQGISWGRLQVNMEQARRHALCFFNVSTTASNSGAAIMSASDKTYVAMVAGGSKKACEAGLPYYNVGYTGQAVNQAAQLFTGRSYKPTYWLGLTADGLDDDLVVDMKALRAYTWDEISHLGECLTKGKPISLAPGRDYSPMAESYPFAGEAYNGLARHHNYVAAALKIALNKMRRKGKKHSKQAMYVALYRRLHDGIPEHDPDAIFESEEEEDEFWADVDRDIRENIYGESTAFAPIEDDQPAPAACPRALIREGISKLLRKQKFAALTSSDVASVEKVVLDAFGDQLAALLNNAVSQEEQDGSTEVAVSHPVQAHAGKIANKPLPHGNRAPVDSTLIPALDLADPLYHRNSHHTRDSADSLLHRKSQLLPLVRTEAGIRESSREARCGSPRPRVEEPTNRLYPKFCLGPEFVPKPRPRVHTREKDFGYFFCSACDKPYEQRRHDIGAMARTGIGRTLFYTPCCERELDPEQYWRLEKWSLVHCPFKKRLRLNGDLAPKPLTYLVAPPPGLAPPKATEVSIDFRADGQWEPVKLELQPTKWAAKAERDLCWLEEYIYARTATGIGLEEMVTSVLSQDYRMSAGFVKDTIQRMADRGVLKVTQHAGGIKRISHCVTAYSSAIGVKNIYDVVHTNDKGEVDYNEDVRKAVPMPIASDEVCKAFDEEARELLRAAMSAEVTVKAWLGLVESKTRLTASVENSKLFQEYVWPDAHCDFQPRAGDTEHLRRIGRVRARVTERAILDPEPTDLMRAWGLVEDNPESKNFGKCKGVLPPRGPLAEMISLEKQLARKRRRARGYSREHLEKYIEGCLPGLWGDVLDMPMKHYIASITRRLDGSKGTGWSARAFGCQTNGEWRADPSSIRAGLLTVILTLLTNHDVIAASTPGSLFKAGLVIPEELAVKDEVHLRKKAEAERWRLIFMTATRGTFRDRFFHDVQNKTEIQAYQANLGLTDMFPHFGACAGMGHDDDSIAQTCANIRRLLAGGRKAVALDAKGWDMSVTRTLWLVDGIRRATLAIAHGMPWVFAYGCLNAALCLSAHVVRCGVDVLEIMIFGIMGSGISSTTSSNCPMRGIVHSEAFWVLEGKVALTMTNGDDCIGCDDITDAHVQHWNALGLELDESENLRSLGAHELIAFTSHLYDVQTDSATYNNADKLLLRLAICDATRVLLTKEQVAGVLVCLRHTPDVRDKVLSFVKHQHPEWDGQDWDSVMPDTSLF